MTKEQQNMLNKIALNKNNLVDGREPKTHLDTTIYREYVIETPLDKAVLGALLRFKWVTEIADEDGDLILQLTELGYSEFEDL
jgi:hypothetical protein